MILLHLYYIYIYNCLFFFALSNYQLANRATIQNLNPESVNLA